MLATRISRLLACALLSAGCGALAAPRPDATPEPAAEARNPRNSGLFRGASADLLLDFAGLRGRSGAAGIARPAFMKTRYSALIAVGHRQADDVLEPAGGEKGVRRSAPAGPCFPESVWLGCGGCVGWVSEAGAYVVEGCV
jgi:hypothetical protein